MNSNESTNPLASEHVTDLVEAYLAGGLDPAERARFEAHVSLCVACARVVAEIEQADRALHEMFQPVQPGVGLEDRILAGFRGAEGVDPSAATVQPGLL